MQILSIKNLTYRYPGQRYRLLDGINLSIQRGEKIGIIGDNGSGKSTLSKLILDIIRPDSGTVELFDKPSRWAQHYPGLGYLGDPSHSTGQMGLPDHLYLRDIHNAVWAIFSQEEQRTQFDRFYSRLALDAIDDRPVSALSTGERKRLMACLALFKPADFIIFDEPLDGLDKEIKPVIKDLISERLQSDTAILYIGHDFSEIDLFTDQVYLLFGGKLTPFPRPRYTMRLEYNGAVESRQQYKPGQVQADFHNRINQSGALNYLKIELTPSDTNEES